MDNTFGFDGYLTQVKNLIYIMPLDFFLPLNLFLLPSSPLSSPYLFALSKICAMGGARVGEESEMQQEVVEMRKRNEEFKSLLLQEQVSLVLIESDFMRSCFS